MTKLSADLDAARAAKMHDANIFARRRCPDESAQELGIDRKNPTVLGSHGCIAEGRRPQADHGNQRESQGPTVTRHRQSRRYRTPSGSRPSWVKRKKPAPRKVSRRSHAVRGGATHWQNRVRSDRCRVRTEADHRRDRGAGQIQHRPAEEAPRHHRPDVEDMAAQRTRAETHRTAASS